MREANLAAAIERILGDRQRHEAQLLPRPTSEQCSFLRLDQPPRLRIYVASREGVYAFIDDRAQLPAAVRGHVEVVVAEYKAVSAEAMAALPPNPLPRVACASECKGEMLFKLGQDNQQRPRVDYVAFLDDDVEAKASDLLRACGIAARRGCPIFQLQLSRDSHAVWSALMQHQEPEGAGPPETWSAIEFVEIMAPVIAQTELDAGLLEVLAPFKSGFGWDSYLLPVLSQLYDDFQPGLFRGACMRHQRPVQTQGNTRFSHGLTACQEEELLRAGLLQCLLQESPVNDRAELLRQLATILHSQDAIQRALASGLAFHTDRQWRCRSLEQQWQQQHDLLQQATQRLQQAEANLGQSQLQLEALQGAILELRTSNSWRLGRLLSSPLRLARRLMGNRLHSG